jgi:hypothetical protein
MDDTVRGGQNSELIFKVSNSATWCWKAQRQLVQLDHLLYPKTGHHFQMAIGLPSASHVASHCMSCSSVR